MFEKHPVYLTFLLLGAANGEHGMGLSAAKATERLQKLLPGIDVAKILNAKGDPDELATEMLEAERTFLNEELALERGEAGGAAEEADTGPNAEANAMIRGRGRGVALDLSGGDVNEAIRAAFGR